MKKWNGRMSLSDWQPRPRPIVDVLSGRYCELQRLNAHHTDALFECSSEVTTEDRFRYLFEDAPGSKEIFWEWMQSKMAVDDPYTFAVVDKRTGLAAGRASYMRITPEHGVIEIGGIFWGLSLAKTRAATEAIFLLLQHAFDDLKYRRVEWKCNNDNLPSKRAAQRFGFQFEGIFRNHFVTKGRNRDTAWFAIIDQDWPLIRLAFESWLNESNFDNAGNQIRSLQAFMPSAQGSDGSDAH